MDTAALHFLLPLVAEFLSSLLGLLSILQCTRPGVDILTFVFRRVVLQLKFVVTSPLPKLTFATADMNVLMRRHRNPPESAGQRPQIWAIVPLLEDQREKHAHRELTTVWQKCVVEAFILSARRKHGPVEVICGFYQRLMGRLLDEM